MLTLSDKIEVTIPYTKSTTDTYYTYYVSNSSSVADAIYKGRAFVAKDQSQSTIYLNDILASQVNNTNILTQNVQDASVVRRFHVMMFNNIGTRIYDTNIEVLLGYVNPFVPASNNIFSMTVSFMFAPLTPLLQGIYGFTGRNPQDIKLRLYPTYPAVFSSKFYPQQVLHSVKHQDTSLVLFNDADDVKEVRNIVTDIADSVVNLSFGTSYAGEKYLGLKGSAFGSESAPTVTGKKLWKITVNGQYLYSSQEMSEFSVMLGYPAKYPSKFYVFEQPEETVTFVYETNNPAEIDAFAEEVHLTDISIRYSYERMNAVYDYSPRLYMKSFDDPETYEWLEEALDITTDYAKNVLGWSDEDAPVGRFTTITLPYKVADPNAIDAWLDWADSNTDIGTFFDTDSMTKESEFYEETYRETAEYHYIKIANIDTCPAKYYLQWIDRYGGIQCQPFNGKELRSIDYKKTNMNNIYDERRLVNSVDTIKFDINTKYIDESAYPYYESILVSPYLRLYDTENDLVYNVISTDSTFQLKTRHNQSKKLLSLNIKLEASKIENILY